MAPLDRLYDATYTLVEHLNKRDQVQWFNPRLNVDWRLLRYRLRLRTLLLLLRDIDWWPYWLLRGRFCGS